MPEVIGKTEDGRDILKHDPSEGCRWKCVSCGTYLRGRPEVRGHFGLFSKGHSLFIRTKDGTTWHQTVEGLFERKQQ